MKNRDEFKNLDKWFTDAKHKPLIISGERQVGKSSLIELLKKTQSLDVLTVNSETAPENARAKPKNPFE